MKYNININQKTLVEIAPELDIIDYAILDYLYFICASVNQKIAQQRIHNEEGIWTWVDYSHLKSEMPALKINSSGAITPRIQAIESSEFIKTMKGKGFRLYVRPLPKMDLAFTMVNAGVHEIESQRSPKRTDNNTNNHSTKIILEKEVAEIIDAFKDVNPAYKKLFSQPPQRDAVKALLAQYGFEDLKRKVECLKKIIVMPYAPRITTPYMLEMKMGDLMAFMSQERGKVKNTWTVI